MHEMCVMESFVSEDSIIFSKIAVVGEEGCTQWKNAMHSSPY